nr:MAG TPA: hypothetical protein [Caudoviricetes sp.]
MKYKLLKDTPTIKAGTIFEEVISDYDELKELVRITPIGAKTSPQFTIQDINNFDEWFEKIEDNIHYQPRNGEKVFCLNEEGDIYSFTFNDLLSHHKRLAFGFVYRTIEEAQKARERRLAEVRLRQTSTFEPDFEDSRGGWVVYYNYKDKELYSYDTDYDDSGEPVHYATEEDSRKSIKENREDWLKYFGIEED